MAQNLDLVFPPGPPRSSVREQGDRLGELVDVLDVVLKELLKLCTRLLGGTGSVQKFDPNRISDGLGVAAANASPQSRRRPLRPLSSNLVSSWCPPRNQMDT